MDHTVHESSEPFPPKDADGDNKKVEPGELLEKCWFFGNLLDRKPRMLRSLSDPCASSNPKHEILPGKSYEETYKSIKKLTGPDGSRKSNLIRAPSLPPCLERKDQNPATGGSSDPGRRQSNRKTMLSDNLLRAPSLPTALAAEDFHDEETEFSMGKLIRQASLSSSKTIPPRTSPAKGVAPRSGLSRHLSITKQDADMVKAEVGLEKVRPQRQMSRLKPQKSLSYLESKELQGFRDLGFDFDKKDLNPSVVSIIPGLQERKRMEDDEEKNRTRPYLSEAWNSAPMAPKWGGKRSKEDNIKAQIKFWARAVASNVR
ncbi:hypothetical protein Sango_1310700 [Sesamum angolense]|uniref:Uncharacterized protein n=1 Tax=Sesamum angolense TaxID=2727404 RepID=A0AAE1WS97_9LAMI|nr:hypothetical protein Sango_1310700 [Sesamum angolense]